MFEGQRIHAGIHVTLVRVLVVQNLVTWPRVAAKVSSKSPAGCCVSHKLLEKRPHRGDSLAGC